MKYNNIMIDCETLGVSSVPVLLSIAAVAFEFTSEVHEMTYLNVHIEAESCIVAGLKVDASTVLWWMQQEKAARNGILDGQADSVPLEDALDKLDKFFYDHATAGCEVWSYGANADISWLCAIHEKLNRGVPWVYGRQRCMRTIVQCFGIEEDRVFPKIEHDALEDAIAQALTLSNTMNRLRA